MDAKEYDLLLGRLAVHFSVLDKDQVASAIKYRQMAGMEDMDLGAFLMAESFIDEATCQKLVKARAQYLQKQGLEPPPGARTPEAAAPSPPAAAAPAAAPPAAPSLPDPFAPQPAPPAPPEPMAGPDDLGAPEVYQDDLGPIESTDDPAIFEPAEPMLPQSAPAAPAPAPAAPLPAGVVPPPQNPAPSLEVQHVQPPAEPAISAAPMPAQEPPPSGQPEAQAPAVAGGGGQGPLAYDATSTLRDLLTRAAHRGASDLHIHCNAPIKLRLNGALRDASEPIGPERARELILPLLDEEQRKLLEEHLQLDFAYSIPGVARYRSNAYEQQNGLDAVFRIIPEQAPTLAQLGIPEELSKVIDYHQGLVLFTGPAGCGKSTTMAAMVRLINHDRPDHIITVEDPIEYVHHSALCLVNQREVGPHTESFARALRAALREDPDIIVIGELRDLETISLALTAAETGHLVLGTLHTSSAVRTINRLLGVFPPDQQNQIRTMVSESLRAVVSQALVPRVDGQGRAAALEVMINTHAIGNLIRENKTFQIPSQMQTGAKLGMKALDNSLAELVQQGVISKEMAQRSAEDPKRFS